jgi:hypothetical protein
MGVIRGKIFHDVEIFTLVRTDGHWPFKKQNDGTWKHTETGELYEPISFAEALKNEGLDHLLPENSE